jgi:ubiquinone/menaquinone biosynthesis C-methylase UbiE
MMQPLRSPALAPEPGYDKIASSYDTWKWQAFWDRNEAPLVGSILCEMRRPTVAMDLGVGTGRYLGLLRKLGIPTTIGVDVSAGMLAVAKRRIGGAGLIRADLRRLPVAPQSIDLVLAARSLCHVPDLSSALHGIAHSLRPGGTFVLTELDAEHAFHNTKAPTPDGDVAIATWKRSVAEITDAAAEAGLTAKEVYRVRAADCAWLPPASELASIDRSSRRAIFLVGVFSKRVWPRNRSRLS